jgi:protein phosphatase 1 regulatory subunit 42
MADLGIESLAEERLALYPSCQCIYDYDNHLKSLEGIENLDLLQELQAQHNQITEIPQLGPFSLSKLDLRHNSISKITGLSEQPEIRELFLSSQNVSCVELPVGCFASQSALLEVLEIAECGLDSLIELRCLENLTVLNLAGNRITSFEELEGLFSHLKQLEKVDLRGNPICKEVKYRERVIVMGKFTELDEKEIVETQRETLRRMMNRKPATPKAPPPKEPAPLRVKRLSK